MDRVSMFTSQPKVSFSHRVAFRSFVAHSRSFRFSAPDSLIRSLPRVLFFLSFLMLVPQIERNRLRINFNYSFTT